MRHGEFKQPARVPSAHLPYGLTARGVERAEVAAHAFVEDCTTRGWEIDGTIESSRLLRAYQTASIVARVAGERLGRPFEVRQREDLAERCVGAAANLRTNEIEAVVAADPRFDSLPVGWKSLPDVRLPFQGAESLTQAGHRVAARIKASVQSMAVSEDHSVVRLFVGHGAAFRYAAVALGALDKGEAPGFSMHYGGYIMFRFDGRSWDHAAGQWKVRARDAIARD